MYSQVLRVLFILCCSFLLTSCLKLHRIRREDNSTMTIKDMLNQFFDTILGEQTNKTFTSTSFPQTFDWLTKHTSKTSKSSHPSSGTAIKSTGKTPTAIKSTGKTPTAIKSTGKTPKISINMSSTTTKAPRTNNITTESPLTRTTTTTKPTEEDLRCTTKVPLEGICGRGLPDLLDDLAMKDIYQIIFANDVITSLLYECMSGHWCLNDRFDYWNGLMMEKAVMVKESKVFDQICSDAAHTCLHKFLANITGCVIQERMNFTVQAINMLCDIRRDKALDLVCYAHVLAALHVTVVEYLRDENNKELRKLSPIKCESPEMMMSKSELCVERKCPNHQKNFLSFSPWQWFTKDIEKYKTDPDCKFPEDTCDEKVQFRIVVNATTKHPSSTGKTTTSHKSLPIGAANDVTDDTAVSFPAKLTMILGIAAGGVIAFSGLFVLVYACWRKHGTLRRADKIGYTPLRNQD